jgi:hypothetical protein
MLMIKTWLSKAVANILVKRIKQEETEENSSNCYQLHPCSSVYLKMKLKISDFEIKKIPDVSDHIYLLARAVVEEEMSEVEVFFQNKLEEKRVFANAELTVVGEWVRSEMRNQLVNSTIQKVRLLTEINLSQLSIKERLNASGLIHEFRDVYKKDKYRALEILKVLGVSAKFAEEMLIKNTYMLPFI